MKYYSELTNSLYETREQLEKAEAEYQYYTLKDLKTKKDEEHHKVDEPIQPIQIDQTTGVGQTKVTVSMDDVKPTAPAADDKDQLTIEDIDNYKLPKFVKKPTKSCVENKDDKTDGEVDDIKEDNKLTRKDAQKDKEDRSTAPDHKDKTTDGCVTNIHVNINGKEFDAEGPDAWTKIAKSIREAYKDKDKLDDDRDDKNDFKYGYKGDYKNHAPKGDTDDNEIDEERINKQIERYKKQLKDEYKWRRDYYRRAKDFDDLFDDLFGNKYFYFPKHWFW